MNMRMLSLLVAAGVVFTLSKEATAFPTTAKLTAGDDILLIQSFPSDGDSRPEGPGRDVEGGSGPAAGAQGGGTASGADSLRLVRRDFLTIKSASLRFDRRIETCDDLDLESLQECLGGALDAYAQDLGKAEVLLPPDESPVPQIIERAARKVRSAASKGQAIAAVREAAAAVRKSIALLVADDPIVQSLTTRAGATIVSSLARTDAKLEQAVGL
jgi:hypothetical protein